MTAASQPDHPAEKRDEGATDAQKQKAPNQGVSTDEPAEGSDDAPGRGEGSPRA